MSRWSDRGEWHQVGKAAGDPLQGTKTRRKHEKTVVAEMWRAQWTTAWTEVERSALVASHCAMQLLARASLFLLLYRSSALVNKVCFSSV